MGDEEPEFVNEAFATNWIAPLGVNVNRFREKSCHTVHLQIMIFIEKN